MKNMNFIKRFGQVAISASILVSSSPLWAWGERGHDLITRVAVQNLRVMSDDNQALVKPFVARNHMLGHLFRESLPRREPLD